MQKFGIELVSKDKITLVKGSKADICSIKTSVRAKVMDHCLKHQLCHLIMVI